MSGSVAREKTRFRVEITGVLDLDVTDSDLLNVTYEKAEQAENRA
jgi:hypothetical protein